MNPHYFETYVARVLETCRGAFPCGAKLLEFMVKQQIIAFTVQNIQDLEVLEVTPAFLCRAMEHGREEFGETGDAEYEQMFCEIGQRLGITE